MFICKPSTDSVLSYCLPLEGTTSVSFPSWARILSRNLCQSSGWGCSKVNALPHLCWCADHLPAHALAPTCPHSQQQAENSYSANFCLCIIILSFQVSKRKLHIHFKSVIWLTVTRDIINYEFLNPWIIKKKKQMFAKSFRNLKKITWVC